MFLTGTLLGKKYLNKYESLQGPDLWLLQVAGHQLFSMEMLVVCLDYQAKTRGKTSIVAV